MYDSDHNISRLVGASCLILSGSMGTLFIYNKHSSKYIVHKLIHTLSEHINMEIS